MAGAIDDRADNAHSPGAPAHGHGWNCPKQPAGWWILVTGVKFTGFWGGKHVYKHVIATTRFLENWQGNGPRDKHYEWSKLTYPPHLGSYIKH